MRSRKKPKFRAVFSGTKSWFFIWFNHRTYRQFCQIALFVGLFIGPVFLSTAQIYETFDQDLSPNSVWKGDITKFKTASGMLQSQSSVANDRFYISTSSKSLKSTQWEFYVSFQFRTSSLNYIDIFLTSDSASLIGQNSGYFLRIGGADDEISFYKKVNNLITKLIDGKNGVTDNLTNSFRIKVIRDSINKFSLYLDSGNLNKGYVLAGEVNNSDMKSSSFAGIVIKQSVASFFNKHFLDDFYIGKIISDTIKPKIIEATILDTKNIRLVFSEPLKLKSVTGKNFELSSGVGFPDSITFLNKDSTALNIKFKKTIPVNQTLSLVIKDCEDLLGNSMSDTLIVLIRWSASKPLPTELIISEFLSDPEPPMALPKVEFVELLNVSKNVIQLQNCSFSDQSTRSYLPEFVLKPDSFVLLCALENKSLLDSFGNVIGLKDFPSLNNSGDELILRNSDGKLLHRVVYDLSELSSNLKSAGGWSFEIIDKYKPCRSHNYTFSDNPAGGTPGKANSAHLVSADQSKPFIKNISFKSTSKIEIEFSKTLDSALVVNLNYYELTGNSIKSVISNYEKITLEFNNQWEQGEIAQLKVSGIIDCLGNVMHDTILNMGWPAEIAPGDIIINEILFNPSTGGADFIEIFNRSQKVLSLKNLAFFNRNSDGDMDEFCLLDTTNRLLMPKEYVVYTLNSEWLSKNYKNAEPKFIQKLAKLPAMGDESGQIGLSDISGLIIDELSYSESMHLPLLTNFEGVSLERIDQSIFGFEVSNYTSAAASYGYATPGLPNSHSVNAPFVDDWLEIEPELVSPDQDGINDLAGIRINTERQGCQATVLIFSPSGNLIKTIVNNIPIGNSQTWFWDGLDEINRKTSIGIYIVYAELFGIDGKRQVKKKTITVGGR
jgi:hypothetical protein